MRNSFPGRPSPATVLSLLALFVALGGVAWAASTLEKDSVKSKHIKDGNVKTADIAGDAVTGDKVAESTLGSVPNAQNAQNAQTAQNAQGVADNSINSAKVADNSLGGNDVDESSLALATDTWHEVGTGGEPGFQNSGFCVWKNFDVNHQSAAFLRDRFGFVHLKGLVDADDVGSGCVFGQPELDELIFTLPAGFRPAQRSIHMTIANNVAARLNIGGPAFGTAGFVQVDGSVDEPNAEAFLSLDGITFRCAPSGANGCP